MVLLDLGLPDMDGLEVIRRIRREATTPIVILSGRYEEREKVEALERGADDYVTKPFGVEELNARLRVALRHAAGPAADADGRDHGRPARVRRRAPRGRASSGRPVDLTPREFEILRVLLGERGPRRHQGPAAARGLGRGLPGRGSYVYVHVSQLRRKLAAADPDGDAARPDRHRAGRRLPRSRAGPADDFRRTLGDFSRSTLAASWAGRGS